MNAPFISALAALVGAAIGGMTSVLASWLTQRTQVRAERLATLHRESGKHPT